MNEFSAKLELDLLQQHLLILQSKLTESQKHSVLLSTPIQSDVSAVPGGSKRRSGVSGSGVSTTEQAIKNQEYSVRYGTKRSAGGVSTTSEQRTRSTASSSCLETPNEKRVTKKGESDCAVALGCTPS
jgi:hypothetical protein